MSLAIDLKANIMKQPKKRTTPLWKGPEEDGVTFSLLSRFLCCRERFRLLVVEGLRPADAFNHRIEYGNMWHVCEEALAIYHYANKEGSPYYSWEDRLKEHCQKLCRRYPTQQEQVDHWYNVCKIQFPFYVDYWSKHSDVTNRAPLLQEQVFSVPYHLPSGRTINLRGKWDSVDLLNAAPPCVCGADRTGPSAEAHSKDCPAGKPRTVRGHPAVYLQENKTKGDINEQQIKRQLTFDLQTMLYLVALWSAPLSIYGDKNDKKWNIPIAGVRYNVVRRPLSGGKGTIVRHKATDGRKCPKCKGIKCRLAHSLIIECEKCEGTGRVGAKLEETKEHFYDRLAECIKDEPEHYFMRWKCEVSPADIAKFRRECLDPILEQLCDWWAFISGGEIQAWNPNAYHWRHPFGVYNVLDEGGSSDLDEYLASGSVVGLTRAESLFTELEQ